MPATIRRCRLTPVVRQTGHRPETCAQTSAGPCRVARGSYTVCPRSASQLQEVFPDWGADVLSREVYYDEHRRRSLVQHGPVAEVRGSIDGRTADHTSRAL